MVFESPVSICGSCTFQICDHSMAEVALRCAETPDPMVPLEVLVVPLRVSSPACSLSKKLIFPKAKNNTND